MGWVARGMLVVMALAAVGCQSNKDKPITDSTANTNKLDNQNKQETFLFPEAPPSNYEHLKGLDFLVGKWKDTSDDFDIVNDVSWDKYKNFLRNRFTVAEGNKEQLEGLQIIGWDPHEKKIRSWIFDTDGGIGESTWREDDGSWYVETVYTLADGRQASSLSIYKKLGDNSYSFTAINRDVDGSILPDINPVKFVKSN